MRRAVVAVAVCATLVAAYSGHDHHHHHDDDDQLHRHDHDHDTPTELTAATWEHTVLDSPHVWVVKFHSKMCGTCQEFKPEWDKLTDSVEGLHWAELNVDEKANVPVAMNLGVLNEGIPNIKVFNLASEPSPLMSSGEVIPAAQLAPTLEQLVAGRQRDSSGYLLAPTAASGFARSEL